MLSRTSVSALAVAGLAAGCISSAAPALDPLETMSFACLQAVEVETGNHDVVVLGSDPRSGQWELTLEVGGTGIWNCEVTQSGQVIGIDFLGSDGSTLA